MSKKYSLLDLALNKNSKSGKALKRKFMKSTLCVSLAWKNVWRAYVANKWNIMFQFVFRKINQKHTTTLSLPNCDKPYPVQLTCTRTPSCRGGSVCITSCKDTKYCEKRSDRLSEVASIAWVGFLPLEFNTPSHWNVVLKGVEGRHVIKHDEENAIEGVSARLKLLKYEFKH